MSDGPFLRALRSATADPTPDAELLRRFVAAGDAAAFELLVRRHAELVWRVCRGVLRSDTHAAEDAFQATFLALARKAGSVSRKDRLGGWLFRVARHTALRARRTAVRQATVPFKNDVAAASGPDNDLAPVVVEEIDRLAAKFREPVLLCFFEGHTHAEAAERLGWAVGTVASRLARAKDRLREQLTRRGLAPAALAAALTGTPAAAVSPTLIRSTVAFGSGSAGPIPAPILTLTEGVLSAMRIAKLKLTAAVASVVVAAAGGLTVAAWAAQTQGSGQAGGSAPGAGSTVPAQAAAKAASDPTGAAPAKTRPGRGGWDRWANSAENLKKIGVAMHKYVEVVGHLPTDISTADGKLLWSWRVHLLPYLEQDKLFKQADLTEPWDSPKNKTVSASVLKVFQCGAEAESEATTCYKRPTGPGTGHELGEKISWLHTADGTSNTLLVVEAGDPVPWAKPGTDFAVDPENPPVIRGPFEAGLNAVRMDGVVMSFPGSIAAKAAKKLSLRADGEVTTPEDWNRAVAWNEIPRKDLGDLSKDIRLKTDEAVKQLAEAVQLQSAALRLESVLAEKAAADFPPALAARLIELEEIIDGMKARRKHIADRLGVKVELLDDLLREYREKK